MRTYYLDDEIIFKQLLQHDVYEDTTAVYRVYKRDYTGQRQTEEVFFVGTIYVLKDDTEISIYLNDIIETQRSISKCIVITDGNQNDTKEYNNNFTTYKIEIKFDSPMFDDIVGEFQVLQAYRYPTLLERCGWNVKNVDVGNSSKLALIREGFYDLSNTVLDLHKSTLLPHVPNGYKFGAYYLLGNRYEALFGGTLTFGYRTPHFVLATETDTVQHPKPMYRFTTLAYDGKDYGFNELYYSVIREYTGRVIIRREHIISPAGLPNWNESFIEDVPVESDRRRVFANYLKTQLKINDTKSEFIADCVGNGVEIEICNGSSDYITSVIPQLSGFLGDYNRETMPNVNTEYIDIAIIDRCPARYYLMWYDRMGGIQCQAFEGKVVFKENINRTISKNLYGNKRSLSNSVVSKWELNSGWLNDEVYPIYESLFVSPYVTLIDTKEDKMFNVIVETTDYTEKTFKTTKKMNNFSLTVSKNKEDKMIY